jgi:hypothetical protein
MGATMEVRYILLGVKMPIESTKKSANFTYWVLAHTTPHKNHFRQPPLHQPPQEARLPQFQCQILPHHASRADRLRPLPQRQAWLHPHGRCRPHLEQQGRSCAYVRLCPPIILWDHCCRGPTSPCRQQQQGSLPPCHSCSSWPTHQLFSRNKGNTKSKIAVECKAAKEAKQKEAKGKNVAAAACKADGLAKKQEKRISSAKAKASTAAAKAETLHSKLVDVMKSAAIPEAAHHHKKSKGMLGTVPTNSPLAHTLPLSPR